MQRVSCFIIAFLVIFPATNVSARDKASSRDAREKAARKACITGDYTTGVDILADLFVETEDITYVFNQGRCYQQNHMWQEALDRFAEYVRKSQRLSKSAKAEVDSHIADCKLHLSGQAISQVQVTPAGGAPELPQPPPAQPSAALVPSVQSEPAVPVASTVAAQSGPGHPEGSGLRIAGLVAGGAGVIAIGIGAALAWKTHDIVDDMYATRYDPAKESSRKSYETWGWVSYGVGATAIITGAAMYLLGGASDRASHPTPPVSLLPSTDGSGAVLLLHGGL
jgi:hypothetical protein